MELKINEVDLLSYRLDSDTIGPKKVEPFKYLPLSQRYRYFESIGIGRVHPKGEFLINPQALVQGADNKTPYQKANEVVDYILKKTSKRVKDAKAVDLLDVTNQVNKFDDNTITADEIPF